MKTLRNVIISGGLFRSDRTPATVGDTVRLDLEDGTTLDAVITALASVNCGQDVNYTFEYESEGIVRARDVVDGGSVLDCCALLDARVTELEENAVVGFFNPTQEITQYLKISGTADNEIVTISDTP